MDLEPRGQDRKQHVEKRTAHVRPSAGISAVRICIRAVVVIILHTPTEGYSTTDPSWRPYTVRQRFSCTFDAGARLIIPIWRFNLFGDFTYHCYLTDNFRAGEFRPSRSYMGLGVGLSFNF